LIRTSLRFNFAHHAHRHHRHTNTFKYNGSNLPQRALITQALAINRCDWSRSLYAFASNDLTLIIT